MRVPYTQTPRRICKSILPILLAEVKEEHFMENRKTLTEQIERLLALADEKQLRLLYIAALQLV